MIATSWNAFAPISLAELNEQAALQKRTDRKYPMHAVDAEMAIATMPPGTRILTENHETSFRYQSIYFDTYGFDSYLQAARARPQRFKVRVRHYLDTDDAFLEVKTKENGQTVKRRVEHDPRSLFEINPSEFEFIRYCLAKGRIADLNPAWLKPMLLTSYRRTTLLTPDGARATFDDELRWNSIGQRTLEISDLVIVETKSAGHASDADHYLWSLGHRPRRISKYATGLAALRQELPANRWHRTLTDYFN